MLRLKSLALLAMFGALSACVRLIPDAAGPATIPAPAPAASAPVASAPSAAGNAAVLGAVRGPRALDLAFSDADAAGALAAFAASCNTVQRREDLSGLTRTDDWRAPCADAPTWPRASARQFFDRHFVPVRVGDGAAFATGYFEPEILGSRTRRPGYDIPVYGLPDDLIRAWPETVPLAEREGRAPLGRRDATGRIVPYYDRTQIEQGALAGRGLEIAWAADAVELFFLQIQGSGRLRTPEGEIVRIGYAGQNGHAYTGIGGLMRQRGLLGEGPGQYAGSMQGIMQYLREQPAAGRALMQENKSWVFFRELDSAPLGSLGIPVTARNSVAVDPRFVPYGAPVFLDLDRAEADGLWVAQDTGGAIKGANRFDTFWGAGEEARRIAGGMSGRGQALIFLPREAATRLVR